MDPKILYKKSSSNFKIKIVATALLTSFFAVAVAVAAAVGACPYASPIGVEARLDLPIFGTRIWDVAERQQIEADLRTELTQQVQQTFPYWCYEPLSGPTPFFALVFQLRQDHSGVFLQAILKAGDQEKGEPQEVRLWKITELAIVTDFEDKPQAEKLEFFRKAFCDELLAKSSVHHQLRQLLKDEVPVANTGDWWSENRTPSVVLPLPWKSQFQEIFSSRFELSCHYSDGDTDDFYAKGSPMPGRYPVKSQNPTSPYDALQVFPRPKPVRPELITCRPTRVLLTEIVRGPAAHMKVGSMGGK